MPYINQEARERLDEWVESRDEEDAHLGPRTSGELNYVLTLIAHEYIERVGGESYSVYAQVISALECAKLELYRRWVAPYEDIKILENGDVP